MINAPRSHSIQVYISFQVGITINAPTSISTHSIQVYIPFQVGIITVALVALDWLVTVTCWVVTSVVRLIWI